MAEFSSRIPGFYKLSPSERLELIARLTELPDEQLAMLRGIAGLSTATADHMVENAIGVFGLPLGIATNFVVNGREVLVPMAIEEPSVIAGASFMARLARSGGGFLARTTEPQMIAQVQLLEVPDHAAAVVELEAARERLLDAIDGIDPLIKKLGGGARDLQFRSLDNTPVGPMLVVHLIFDTRDAMGANTVNTAAEKLAPELEALSGGRAHLRILSNLADRRLAFAECRIPCQELAFEGFPGERVRDGILEAWAFAESDPYRAATHNKGIMNGIDAVVIATGNDWRAVEAGAHAYAARQGRYTSLSRWWAGKDGDLHGSLELPLALGIVGGATRVNPAAGAALALMGVSSARELAEITVSVGLAQNLAAIRALATEGIQRGHMSLHARQVAIAAGAAEDQVEQLAARLAAQGDVRLEEAERLLRLMNTSENG